MLHFLVAHTLLAMLESISISEQIPQKQGYFIYVYADFHIPRVNLFAQENSWLKMTPYYQKKENSDEMKYIGSMEEARPLWTSFLGFLNETLNWSYWTGRNFPWITERHLRYTCDIISASQAVFHSKFPDSEFVVWVHPMERPMDLFVKKCLKQKNVTVLDQRDNINFNDSHRIPRDGHPTARANELMADILWQELKNIPIKLKNN